MTPITLANMFAEMEAREEKVLRVLFSEPYGVFGLPGLWGAVFVQDDELDPGVIVLESSESVMRFIYWHPPGSLTNGHFWVLKRLVADGKGLWDCSLCGLSVESKSVLGFRVAVPHWADLKGDSCEQRVVDLVHAS